MEKLIVLDIETENTGYDIMNHNKRIISIQLYDGNDCSIFYDGADKNTLAVGKFRLESLISQNYAFVGFNVRNFDVFFLNKFLGIQIPRNQILDIGEMPNMQHVREKLGKKKPRLEEICDGLGIDCSYKKMMNKLSVKFRDLPGVLAMAKEGSEKWVKELGWGQAFSYNLALDKIAGGMAILESFNEFARNGDINSLFYRYAMGDVFAEHQLFLKMQK